MKKVLLTGGSKGIGKAIYNLLNNEGYDVFAPTRKDLDLSSNKSIDKFLQKYSNCTFDIIINNAGVNYINLIDDLSIIELNDTININLITPIKLIKAFIGDMKSNKYGRIVNISSIWSVVSKAGRLSYSASKNGLNGVTKSLATELAEFNILINSVSPGFTKTELTNQNNTLSEIEEIEKMIPLRRMANPLEIAKLVHFLVSNDNTYITGQNIIIDGGYTSI